MNESGWFWEEIESFVEVSMEGTTRDHLTIHKWDDGLSIFVDLSQEYLRNLEESFDT